MALIDALGRYWQGWVGDIYPRPRPLPKLPALDARQHALDALCDFIADLPFEIPGAKRITTFQVPRDNIFTEQPPDPSQLSFPALSFVPVRGLHDNYGLGPNSILDETFNVYAPGTVLLSFGEYTEYLTLEVWGEHGAQRTSMIAGIQSAIRRGEWSCDLFLQLRNYYGVVARYALEESEHIDDADVVRGRMRGHLYIRLAVPEVTLVDAVTMKPYFKARYVDEIAQPADDS